LLDRMMGELRAAMESRGTWDHTVLLMSADHPDRASAQLDGKSDWRVPFLLRFPGRPAAGAVTPEFSTILSANLVYAILRGSVSTAAQASEWIERRQADRESPVGAAD
jgi:arylsulfatase A-like enzyme